MARQKKTGGDREMDRRLARQIEQWVRDLYVFDGNEVRKLTKREIQIAAGRKPARRRRQARR